MSVPPQVCSSKSNVYVGTQNTQNTVVLLINAYLHFFVSRKIAFLFFSEISKVSELQI